MAQKKDWREQGVRVVTSERLDFDTAQTPGMTRAAAINRASAGAEKLWAGTVEIYPNEIIYKICWHSCFRRHRQLSNAVSNHSRGFIPRFHTKLVPFGT